MGMPPPKNVVRGVPAFSPGVPTIGIPGGEKVTFPELDKINPETGMPMWVTTPEQIDLFRRQKLGGSVYDPTVPGGWRNPETPSQGIIPSIPTFKNVYETMNNPVGFTPLEKPVANTGISPQTQSMIDILTRAAESKARAAVIRRGMEGSSTEALNVGRAAADASAPLLAEDLAQKNKLELQYLQQQADRGNVQAQVELDRRKTLGLLTSDELASLRGMSDAEKNRQVQLELGRLGIGQANSAADAAEHAASSGSKTSLWSSISSGAATGITAAIILPF